MSIFFASWLVDACSCNIALNHFVSAMIFPVVVNMVCGEEAAVSKCVGQGMGVNIVAAFSNSAYGLTQCAY
jgi:hypothetical protein